MCAEEKLENMTTAKQTGKEHQGDGCKKMVVDVFSEKPKNKKKRINKETHVTNQDEKKPISKSTYNVKSRSPGNIVWRNANTLVRQYLLQGLDLTVSIN